MHLQYLTPQTQETLVRAPAQAYAQAVALAAAFAVVVPTAPVDDINTYAVGATEQALCRVVGIFNEVRPLDCEATMALALGLWKARYEVAHGLILEKVQEVSAASPLDLFGIGFCVSFEASKALCDNAAAIMPVLGACIRAARQIVTSADAQV